MANERRLIDANYARETATIDLIVHHIDRQPTVDAVEVVRCEGCVYGVEDDCDKGVWQCTKDAEYDEDSGMYFGFNSWHDADFFCAYGERRCE